MSSQHYRWAWAQPLTCTRKAVLLNLVERANDEGKCYPSIARIAQDTGTDRKTVMAALSELSSMGLISRAKGTGNSNQYTLNTQTQAEAVPKTGPVPKTGQVPKTGPEQSQKRDLDQYQKRDTNPPYNPPITPQECVSHADTPEQPANDPPAPTPKPRKRPLPADFAISDGVRRWAAAKGYADLDAHFESFCLKCQAKGYQYADWDAALKTAIRDDWAGLRRPQSHRNQPGAQTHEAVRRPMSAFDRVRQSGIEYLRRHGEENIIDINAYRPEQSPHGEPVGEDDGDLWPSVDVAIRRL